MVTKTDRRTNTSNVVLGSLVRTTSKMLLCRVVSCTICVNPLSIAKSSKCISLQFSKFSTRIAQSMVGASKSPAMKQG